MKKDYLIVVYKVDDSSLRDVCLCSLNPLVCQLAHRCYESEVKKVKKNLENVWKYEARQSHGK